MENKISIKICIGIIVLILFLTSFVNAFGVSSDYWKGNPLKISHGETKTITLRLQNMVDANDITVRAVLKNGEEIASVEEKDYLVRMGTKDTEVPITVSIPDNVPIGSDYEVTVSFNTVTPSGEGTVSIGTGIDTSFDVLVVPIPPKIVESAEGEDAQLAPAEGIGGNSNLILWIIGIVILLIIIVIIIKLIRRNK